MSGNSNSRNKQRFANQQGWMTNSNQTGRVGVTCSISASNYITRRTSPLIKDANNNIVNTKNLVIVQNQLSRGGGPSPMSGMFAPRADGAKYKITESPL